MRGGLGGCYGGDRGSVWRYSRPSIVQPGALTNKRKAGLPWMDTRDVAGKPGGIWAPAGWERRRRRRSGSGCGAAISRRQHIHAPCIE